MLNKQKENTENQTTSLMLNNSNENQSTKRYLCFPRLGWLDSQQGDSQSANNLEGILFSL